MNVMFKIAGKIVTPALSGSILPGITRKSCIELLKDWGYTVEERPVSVDELFAAAIVQLCQSRRLQLDGVAGLAAVNRPLKELVDMRAAILKGLGLMLCLYELYKVAALLQVGIQRSIAVDLGISDASRFPKVAAFSGGQLANQLFLYLPD